MDVTNENVANLLAHGFPLAGNTGLVSYGSFSPPYMDRALARAPSIMRASYGHPNYYTLL